MTLRFRDCQLEDQRLLQIKNRNPQLLIPTKVERVRSEIMIAKHGSSRPIAVKANVINKVVREAKGDPTPTPLLIHPELK